ncbi:MAG: hypothetical protein AAB865_00905 [Patescibacteria group bacterium]
MLTKKDLQQIREVVREVVRAVVKDETKDFVRKDELKLEFEAQGVLIRESFEEVQGQFNVVNYRIDGLYNAVDGFVKRITRLDDEYEVIKIQMARWEKYYPLPQT